MKVVVPFTNVRPETRAALEEHAAGYTIDYVDVSGSDDALWTLWRDLWAAQRDVVVVEHDIVIHRHVLGEFEACPQPWCTFPYPYLYGNSDPYHGTGCVRFRADLMRAFPDLWDVVAQREGPHHPKKHWCAMDGFSQLELWRRDYFQHKHEPAVGHADPSNSHGCLGTF